MRGRIVGTGERTQHYIDGCKVSKEVFDAAFPDQPICGRAPGGTPTKGWPIHSDAVGVHPLDVAEAEKDAKAKGVPTTFDDEGRAVLTDRAHRKRYLRAYGFRDNNGGYGD